MLSLHPDHAPQESLNELIAESDEAVSPPPPPLGGIPAQRLPGWIRWPVRVAFLPFMLLDLAMQRIARLLVTPPFKKIGKCLRRGNCCYTILVPEAKGLLGKLFYFWNTEILGFYRRDPRTFETEGKRVYAMGCRYLSKEGKCTRYLLRPSVCRKWPMIEYFGYPRILKGCGYKAVPRDGADKPGT